MADEDRAADAVVDEEAIRRLAYHLWEQEGSPAGRERAHWDEAKRMLETSAEEGKAGTPAGKRTTRSRAKTGDKTPPKSGEGSPTRASRSRSKPS